MVNYLYIYAIGISASKLRIIEYAHYKYPLYTKLNSYKEDMLLHTGQTGLNYTIVKPIVSTFSI